MRYLATVGGQEYQISLEEPNTVRIGDTHYAVDLQSVDGETHYSLLVGATSCEVFVERCKELCVVILDGHRYQVRVEDDRSQLAGEQVRPALEDPGIIQVTSPMPGVVVAVLVQEGQLVRTGEGLAILEAMKMENEIRASRDGIVAKVQVVSGQQVRQEEDLFHIAPPGAGSEADL